MREKTLHAFFVVLSVLGLVSFPFLLVLSQSPWGYDTWAYAHVDLGDLYGNHQNLSEFGAFRYPPPAALAFAVADVIPWPAFLYLWTAVLIACVLYVGGRRYSLAILGIPFVALELHYGNVNLILAASIVASYFVSPVWWVLVLLTKPTCGVALIWYVAGRQWRYLGKVLGVTAAIAVPTLVVRPDLWVAWVLMILDNARLPQLISIWPRLGLAAVLAALGGWRRESWAIPLAASLAIPTIWYNQMAISVALVPFLVGRTRIASSGVTHSRRLIQRIGEREDVAPRAS